MRGFYKRLRKNLQTACLAAALATSWQVGQAAKADVTPPPEWGDEVTVNFSGSISPAQNDLSHVFLLYGTGYSGLYYGPWAVKLGDYFPAGVETDFSVSGPATYQESIFWCTAGLYGDISSGVYQEGVNGVNLGNAASEGMYWDWCIYPDVNESDVFDYLLNDTPENMTSSLAESYLHAEYMSDLEFTGSSFLFDFSQASQNGQMQIQSEIIPEPFSIVLFGTGGMIVVALRRRNE